MFRLGLFMMFGAWLGAQTVPPMPPHSGFMNAEMTATPSLVESTASAKGTNLTVFEKSNYTETGDYAEALAFFRAMALKYPAQARLLTIGQSPQGRPLVVLILSKEGAFTPALARRTNKPVVFVQNGIHAGEIGGKDASMMLIRDVLVTRRYAKWLDGMILAFMPVFNVDGHEMRSAYHRINQNGPKEMGFRGTSQRLNLNRDYMKADAPEMRAWLKFYTAWLPDFFIDQHVTDGQDAQYDLTVDIPDKNSASPQIAAWADHWYGPYLNQEMARLGHVMAPYLERGRGPGSYTESVFSPRYSHAYAALRNRGSLLVETHSLKPYRTEVWAHYDVMKVTFDGLLEFGTDLRKAALAGDEAEKMLAGSGTQIALDGKVGDDTESYEYKGVKSTTVTSAISGGTYTQYSDEPIQEKVILYRQWVVTKSASMPKQYVIPAQWTDIIDRLMIHGIKLDRVTKEQTLPVTEYVLRDGHWAERPFEGRHVMSFTTTSRKAQLALHPGDYIVDLKQVGARVAQHLLEPDAADSLVHWGLLDPVFEQKEYFSNYVFEPIAKAMLERDAALKAEYDTKVSNDAAFAKNPTSRLRWLYERSPYLESDRDVYPVRRLE